MIINGLCRNNPIESINQAEALRVRANSDIEKFTQFEQFIQTFGGFVSAASAYEQLAKSKDIQVSDLEESTKWGSIVVLNKSGEEVAADYAIVDPFMRNIVNEEGYVRIGNFFYYISADGGYILPEDPATTKLSKAELIHRSKPVADIAGMKFTDGTHLKSLGGSLTVVEELDEGTIYYGTRRRAKWRIYEKLSRVDDRNVAPFPVEITGFESTMQHQRKSKWNGIWWAEKADRMSFHSEWVVRNQSTGSVFTLTECRSVIEEQFGGSNVAPFLEVDNQNPESRWNVLTARVTLFVTDGGGNGQAATVVKGPLATLPPC